MASRNLRSILFIVLAGVAGLGQAQQPLRIIIGFPPGGSTDSASRIVGEHMRGTLGRPVVVENKPGAAGRLAQESVKDAAPDGNTVLLTLSGPMTLTPYVFANLREWTEMRAVGSGPWRRYLGDKRRHYLENDFGAAFY
ncbi:MAG: hypothetical protein H7Y16_01630 [Candidatus Parcubacteria bacterium]|nr:hypothetical protein [Burkholderiales bacterium]